MSSSPFLIPASSTWAGHLPVFSTPFQLSHYFFPPSACFSHIPSFGHSVPSAWASLHLSAFSGETLIPSHPRSNVSSAVNLSLAPPDGISSLCDPRMFSQLCCNLTQIIYLYFYLLLSQTVGEDYIIFISVSQLLALWQSKEHQ